MNSLISTIVSANEQHDPLGEDIQLHMRADGSCLITYSDAFAAKHDYQLGDQISYEIKNAGVSMVNRDAQLRELAPKVEAELDRKLF